MMMKWDSKPTPVEVFVAERKYWLDLFTGETWEDFHKAGGRVSGFRQSRWSTVQKIKPGDWLLCYAIGISRWMGILEVVGEPYQDSTPIWRGDEFPCRLPVKVVLALPPERAVPVKQLSNKLSYFLRSPGTLSWTGHFRASPVQEKPQDAQAIIEALLEAEKNPVDRPFNEARWRRTPKVYEAGDDTVTVPGTDEAEPEEEEVAPPQMGAASHEEIQWVLLRMGSEMGFDLWVARNDRRRSFGGQEFGQLPNMKSKLPAQFDEATNRTIELIDVLWLDGNTIVAAFEVEHTTSIYSGLLRMADLVAMQPNLNIRLFIVAPDERREKVLEEIDRPTFSKMKTPLREHCRFIPYSELKKKYSEVGDYLQYLKPEFLDEIAEQAT